MIDTKFNKVIHSNKKDIDISYLSAGIYILKIFHSFKKVIYSKIRNLN